MRIRIILRKTPLKVYSNLKPVFVRTFEHYKSLMEWSELCLSLNCKLLWNKGLTRIFGRKAIVILLASYIRQANSFELHFFIKVMKLYGFVSPHCITDHNHKFFELYFRKAMKFCGSVSPHPVRCAIKRGKDTSHDNLRSFFSCNWMHAGQNLCIFGNF